MVRTHRNDSLTNAIEKELLEAPTPVFKDIDLSDFEEIDIPLKKGHHLQRYIKYLSITVKSLMEKAKPKPPKS